MSSAARPVVVHLLLALAVAGVTAWALAPSHANAQVRAPAGAQARGAESPPCTTGSNCRLHRLYYATGETTTTGASGFEEGINRRLGRSVDPVQSWEYLQSDPLLTSITVGERGDEPCYLRIESDDVGDHETWNGCGNAGPASRRTVEWWPHQGLVGIQVCTNNRDGDRGKLVKGVRVRVARRPHLSGPDRMIETQQFARPNCRRWRSWRSCPGGSTAIDLVAHHMAIGGRRGIVGLRLVCAPVGAACFETPVGTSSDDPVCRPS
jgi:hypothetical protein